MPYGPDFSSDNIPVWTGSTWSAQKLVNAQVDTAAAIAYSKLNLSASIVNADVAPAAAIAYSKLSLAGSLVAGDAGFAYSNYTPTWASSGTQPAIGNGTLVGRKLVLGKLVQGAIILTAGSTTTFGTGNYSFSLPVAPGATLPTNFSVGTGGVVHSASLYPVQIVLSGSTVFLGIPAQPIGTFVGPSAPGTLASGDILFVNFSYESA